MEWKMADSPELVRIVEKKIGKKTTFPYSTYDNYSTTSPLRTFKKLRASPTILYLGL
jgi:hypothetical protein